MALDPAHVALRRALAETRLGASAAKERTSAARTKLGSVVVMVKFYLTVMPGTNTVPAGTLTARRPKDFSLHLRSKGMLQNRISFDQRGP